jgi:hypothetical protein
LNRPRFRRHQVKTHQSVARIPPGSSSDLEMRPRFLACGNGLGFSDRKALAAIRGNGTIDNGTTIDAFPGIKHDKEIREPL